LSVKAVRLGATEVEGGVEPIDAGDVDPSCAE
jgi:hypothetical protein